MTTDGLHRTVDGMFREAASRYPQRNFLRQASGHQSSYGDVARSIDAICEQLLAIGLSAGDRAVFYLEAPTATVLFNLACANLGVIPVPLSPTFSAKALGKLVERLSARLIVTTTSHAAVPERSVPVVCLADTGLPRDVVAVDPTPRRSLAEALTRLTGLAHHGAEAPYIFQPTSGTTAEPKIVMRSHAVFARVARIIARDLPPADAEPQARMLLVAALTHGMGQYLMVTTLHLAGALCIPSDLDTNASLAEIRALDPTLMGMTPRVLRALHDQRRPADARWVGPAARVLFVGGSVTQPELLRELASDGVAICEGYGASEISLLSQTRLGRYREGTSGEVLEDVSLRIADDGELLARSPGVMLGYFGDEALTREAFTADGYYRTGDYCEITPDGYLRYLGRKRDVFNTNEGANIHPGRIEALLEALPGVRQVVLLGDQRPYLSALIVVDATARPSADPDGYLDPLEHPAAYEQALAAISPVNEGLESPEQIRRIALFDRPFPEEMYRLVGHAKISRNRALFGERYARRIEALYSKQQPR